MINLPTITTAILAAGALILGLITGAAAGSSESSLAPDTAGFSSALKREATGPLVTARRFPSRTSDHVRYITDKKELTDLLDQGLVGKDDPHQELGLSSSKKALTYHGGCNFGSAPVTSIDDNGVIHLGGGSWTDMACGGARWYANEQLFSVLITRDSLVIAELIPQSGKTASGEETHYLVGNGKDGIVFTKRKVVPKLT